MREGGRGEKRKKDASPSLLLSSLSPSRAKGEREANKVRIFRCSQTS